jgi:hypothetical protein
MSRPQFSPEELNGTVRVSLPRAARWLGVDSQTLRRWLTRDDLRVPYALVGCQPKFSLLQLHRWQTDNRYNEYFGPNNGLLGDLLDTIPSDWDEDDIEWLVFAYQLPMFRHALLELFLAEHKGKSPRQIKALADKTYALMKRELGTDRANAEVDRICAMRETSPKKPTPRRKTRPRARSNGKAGKGDRRVRA